MTPGSLASPSTKENKQTAAPHLVPPITRRSQEPETLAAATGERIKTLELGSGAARRGDGTTVQGGGYSPGCSGMRRGVWGGRTGGEGWKLPVPMGFRAVGGRRRCPREELGSSEVRHGAIVRGLGSIRRPWGSDGPPPLYLHRRGPSPAQRPACVEACTNQATRENSYLNPENRGFHTEKF